MYEAHFGLNTNPFSSSPSPEFIYESGEHREALAHFRFALANREAFLLLTGEVGTGKTTAIQALRRMLEAGTPVAVITHTTLEPRELLEEIAIKFGLEPAGGESKPVLMRRLETFLWDRRRAGGHALLVLDEAHLLAPALLEEVRLLSNLESEEGGKLLQICLVGQPELQTHLQQPELRQLRQRISVRYALKPLTAEETTAYIYHRLMAAGSDHPSVIFPREATTAVHALTQGIPREINVLAGQAMLNAYLDEAAFVTRGHVFSAKADYGFQGIVTGAASLTPDVSPPPTPRRVPTAVEPPRRPAPPDRIPPPEAPSAPERAARRPIPLPPEALRPEPPEGYEPPPEPAARPEAESGAAGTRAGRAPARLAAGPGLAEPRRRRGNRRGLYWVAVVVIAAALVMAFGWWQTLNEGQRSGEELEPPPDRAADTRSGLPGDGSAAPAAGREQPGTGEMGGGEATPPENQAATDEGVLAAGDSDLSSGPPSDAEPGAVGTGMASEAGEPEPAAGGPAAGAADLAENRSAGAGEESPTGATDQNASPAGRPPAASPSGEGAASPAGEAGVPLAIQVASFRTRTRAEQVLAQVRERTGLPGVVLPAEVNGTVWYRILLGSFTSEAEAERAAEPLLRRRIIREVVTREIPEAWVATLSGRPGAP